MFENDQSAPNKMNVSAILLGQSIELRRLSQVHILSRDPTTIEVIGGGYAMLFRFGVVVLIDVPSLSQASFLELLMPFVLEPFESTRTESLQVVIDLNRPEQISDGILYLQAVDIPQMKVLADILAKSVFLDDYEIRTASIFDRIEPLAERMQSRGHIPRQSRDLIVHIGEMLKIQHRMVGRAQVGEKPDVLWEHPELERLWHRLENEYEIGERQLALERKLELVSSTAETLLGLLQDRRTLRVEWYITILIVIEIFLTLYELFFRH